MQRPYITGPFTRKFAGIPTAAGAGAGAVADVAAALIATAIVVAALSFRESLCCISV